MGRIYRSFVPFERASDCEIPVSVSEWAAFAWLIITPSDRRGCGWSHPASWDLSMPITFCAMNVLLSDRGRYQRPFFITFLFERVIWGRRQVLDERCGVWLRLDMHIETSGFTMRGILGKRLGSWRLRHDRSRASCWPAGVVKLRLVLVHQSKPDLRLASQPLSRPRAKKKQLLRNGIHIRFLNLFTKSIG